MSGWLILDGTNLSGNVIYHLSGGNLMIGSLEVTIASALTQTGGRNTVNDRLLLGGSFQTFFRFCRPEGSEGSNTVSGFQFQVKILLIIKKLRHLITAVQTELGIHTSVANPPQKDRQRQVFSKTASTVPGWLSGIFPTHFPPISHFYSLVKELGEGNFAECGELFFFADYCLEIID